MRLDEGKINEKLIIKNISIFGKERRRFYDLGIVPGAKITKLYNSMFNDPVCYLVKSSRVALRNREAKCIEVEKFYG